MFYGFDSDFTCRVAYKAGGVYLVNNTTRQSRVDFDEEERGAAAAIMADGEHLAEDPNKYWRLKKALEDSWLLIYYDLTNEIELTWTFVDKH